MEEHKVKCWYCKKELIDKDEIREECHASCAEAFPSVYKLLFNLQNLSRIMTFDDEALEGSLNEDEFRLLKKYTSVEWWMDKSSIQIGITNNNVIYLEINAECNLPLLFSCLTGLPKLQVLKVGAMDEDYLDEDYMDEDYASEDENDDYFVGNYYSELWFDLSKLKSLKILKLSNLKLPQIPYQIFDLPDLEMIDLSHNQIRTVPDQFGSLKNLKLLDLTKNRIYFLSQSFTTIDFELLLDPHVHLCNEKHSLKSNLHYHFTEPSDEIVRWEEKYVDGYIYDDDELNCALRKHEKDILEQMWLAYGRRQYWEDEGCCKTGLCIEFKSKNYTVTELIISSDQFGSYRAIDSFKPITNILLPIIENILELARGFDNLISLTIEKLPLDRLPDNIKKFPKLLSFRCNGLILDEIPEIIRYLPNLWLLDFSDNNITFIPSYIKELKNLKYLNTLGTPLFFLLKSFSDIKFEHEYRCGNIDVTKNSLERFNEFEKEKFLNREVCHENYANGLFFRDLIFLQRLTLYYKYRVYIHGYLHESRYEQFIDENWPDYNYYPDLDTVVRNKRIAFLIVDWPVDLDFFFEKISLINKIQHIKINLYSRICKNSYEPSLKFEKMFGFVSNYTFAIPDSIKDLTELRKLEIHSFYNINLLEEGFFSLPNLDYLSIYYSNWNEKLDINPFQNFDNLTRFYLLGENNKITKKSLSEKFCIVCKKFLKNSEINSDHLACKEKLKNGIFLDINNSPIIIYEKISKWPKDSYPGCDREGVKRFEKNCKNDYFSNSVFITNDKGYITHLALVDKYQEKISKIAADFKHLEVLYLESDLLSQVRHKTEAVDFGTFTNLKKLYIRNSKKLPSSVGNLKRLEFLDINSMDFKEIPVSIGNLTNLKSIYICSNKLKTIPDSIGKCVKLEKIRIFRGSTSIPDSIGKCVRLKELEISGNFTSIPDSIGDCVRLEKLCISGDLTTIPRSIGKCFNLKEIDLQRNKITNIPETISNLQELIKLDLGYNQITNLPKSIGKLGNLKTLLLFRNQISHLPDSMRELRELTNLNLSKNNIRELPNFFKRLKKLRHLNLMNNPIKTLPDWILEFKNLQLDIGKTINQIDLSAKLKRKLGLSSTNYSSIRNFFCKYCGKDLDGLGSNHLECSSLSPNIIEYYEQFLDQDEIENIFSFEKEIKDLLSEFENDLRYPFGVTEPFLFNRFQHISYSSKSSGWNYSSENGKVTRLSLHIQIGDIIFTQKVVKKIPKSIVKFKYLRKLEIFERDGNIVLPENFNQLVNLEFIVLKSKHCYEQMCKKVDKNDLPEKAIITYTDYYLEPKPIQENGDNYTDQRKHESFQSKKIEKWTIFLKEILQQDKEMEILEYGYKFGNLIIREDDIKNLILSTENFTVLSFKIFQLCNIFRTAQPPFYFIPESLGLLTDLQKLDLGFDSSLKSLPNSISNLVNLEELIINSSKIESFISSITKIPNLRRLHLNNCKFNSLPENIGNLQHLEELYLKGCGLKTLPDTIGLLSNLKILDLRENKLNSLPESLANLSKLRKLSISDNEFQSISLNLSKLKNLELFSLVNNNLRSLPDSFTELSSKIKIRADLHTMDGIPFEICRKIVVEDDGCSDYTDF